MPKVDKYETQQPIAFLKLLIEKGFFYTKDNKDLENVVWNRHKEVRKLYVRHEWMFDTDLEVIVESVKMLYGYISSDYTIEEDINN